MPEQIGLDVERFSGDVENDIGAARIAEDVDGADLSGVSGDADVLHQRTSPLRRVRHRDAQAGGDGAARARVAA